MSVSLWDELLPPDPRQGFIGRIEMAKFSGRYARIYEQWKKFISGDEAVDASVVPGYVWDAWKRCRANGVDPFIQKVPLVLTGESLNVRLRQNEDLIEISRPFMKNLYAVVKGSGFIVILMDTEGYLLDFIGDEDAVSESKKGNMLVGSRWSEHTAGNNGLQTAYALGRPAQVIACEHYCIILHRWTTSGAMIRNPQAKIIGGIGMSGPYRKVHPHTLGMVVAAAHAIENALKVNKVLSELQIAYGLQEKVLSAIPDALIAINTSDEILIVNSTAQHILGAPSANLLGSSLSTIFEGNENKVLRDLIAGPEEVADIEVQIARKNKAASYTLSTNIIWSPLSKRIGKIITFKEIKKVRSLVYRMVGAEAKFRFEDIVGSDSGLKAIVKLAKMAAGSVSNLLLLGESGTGKDVLAQAVHNGSRRSDGPYVAINCAAIPRDLISSELFGYSSGAFTGAKKGGNQGKFELADKGTIFLDEIGEMPPDLQASLLRVIEDKAITRIGSKSVIPLDVRIIAATNKNLREEVNKGNFREDLYYRLNVLTIEMIPLRERKMDIPLLVQHFIASLRRRLGKHIDRIQDGAMELLLEYPWPGNVRELQNVIERAVNIMPGTEFTVELLPNEITHQRQASRREPEIIPLDEMERRMIIDMVRSHAPKSDIARKLKISRSTLYRKIAYYRLR
jgi:sigma-54 dependent transcriptional regulator, acetoin dehydrogenase operon transcriptional activator AcoR